MAVRAPNLALGDLGGNDMPGCTARHQVGDDLHLLAIDVIELERCGMLGIAAVHTAASQLDLADLIPQPLSSLDLPTAILFVGRELGSALPFSGPLAGCLSVFGVGPVAATTPLAVLRTLLLEVLVRHPSPAYPGSWFGVVAGRVADLEVARAAGGEQVRGVVAHRLASGVMGGGGAAGAAGELELAAVPVALQHSASGAAPGAGAAGLPAPARPDLLAGEGGGRGGEDADQDSQDDGADRPGDGPQYAPRRGVVPGSSPVGGGHVGLPGSDRLG